MHRKIEKALSGLIGQPFWLARRVSNLACFDFGERHQSTNKMGEPFEQGEYVIHIQCPWRFTHFDEIVVASMEMVYPPDSSADTGEDFKRDSSTGNLNYFRMKTFMEEHAGQPLKVTSIEAGRAGFVSIYFDHNFVLDIFPAHSVNGDNYVEHWRLLKAGDEYFVYTGNGIEARSDDNCTNCGNSLFHSQAWAAAPGISTEGIG